MGVLVDWQIRDRRLLPIEDPRSLRLDPFVDYSDQASQAGMISFGLSSGGYDMRCRNRFLLFQNTSGIVVDPKDFRPEAFAEVTAADHEAVVIPPNCFALAETVEVLDVPRDCLIQCVGKSTYARAGYVVPLTPFEPRWRGRVTLEVGNLSPLPMKVYAGEGICQMVFHRLDALPERDYDQKPRKHYQDQAGLLGPRVNK